MRGGKRQGAGRKAGPDKVRLTAFVLPETAQEVNRRAVLSRSLGEFLDEVFRPPNKKVKN